MGEPLLSIIIVSYENSSLILRRALQSVLEQSYKNYEIILVDANESGMHTVWDSGRIWNTIRIFR